MKNKSKKELAVCGFEAVKALCRLNPEKIRRLYFDESHRYDFGDICKKMAERKAPYNIVKDVTELEKLCGSVHHQGVVAMIAQPEIEPLSKEITLEWLHTKQSALVLDRVGNANNLGAIVRSAAFFGMKNIVIPLDESQSSITTSSYRVAQGGMELVNIYSVRSIPKLLLAMKGKMVSFGTDLKAKKNVSEISSLCGNKPALIVLGNEEEGISSEVRKCCDELIIIPFAGFGGATAESSTGLSGNKNGISAGNKIGANKKTTVSAPVQSLNVAQASSVILYEWAKNGNFSADKSERV